MGRPEHSTWKKNDSSRTWNYCQRKGHGKNECPALKGKAKFSGSAQVKPTTLAAPVVSSAQLVLQMQGHCDALCPTVSESESKGDYSAFISDGYVSLPGKEEVAVKILRDTGALHTFVCESILPFYKHW